MVIISAIGSSAYALPFTTHHFDFGRHENFYAELLGFSILVGGTIASPALFDSVAITDPLGNIILDTADPLRFDPDSGYFLAFAGGLSSPTLGNYTVTVTGTDGSDDSTSVEATASSFSTSTPIIANPVDSTIITDPTPTLSWEAFESAEKGSDESLSYLVEIGSPTFDPGEEDLAPWRVGLPEDVASVTYNFDSSALPGFEELSPGNYAFHLFAFEDRWVEEEDRMYRRSSTRSSNFTVEPIPELSTILLLTAGLSGMAAYGFRRKKKA